MGYANPAFLAWIHFIGVDPVGRVAPRLVRLIVAPLALLARESDGDSDFSASHLLDQAPPTAPHKKTTPA
jgi:hypothetical protein